MQADVRYAFCWRLGVVSCEVLGMYGRDERFCFEGERGGQEVSRTTWKDVRRKVSLVGT